MLDLSPELKPHVPLAKRVQAARRDDMKPYLGVIILRPSSMYVSTDELLLECVHRSASLAVYAVSKGDEHVSNQSTSGRATWAGH